MDLKCMTKDLKQEVQGQRNQRRFDEAKRRHSVLAHHEDVDSVLAVLGDETPHRYWEREAITRALIVEHQRRPHRLWSATDFKILLQRRDVTLPRDRELVGQIHSIKRRVLPSGKVAFDTERTHRAGHADRFWAIALACQKERGPASRGETEIGVRVIG